MDKQTQVDGAVGSDGGGSRADRIWPTPGCRMRLISEYCGDPNDPEWHPYKGSHLYFVPESETTTARGYCWAHKHFSLWSVGRMLFEKGLLPIDSKRIQRDPAYDTAIYALAGKWAELFPLGILVQFDNGSNPSAVAIEIPGELAASPAKAPGLSNTEGTADQSDSTKEDV